MQNAVMLCSTNADTKNYNLARIKKLGTALVPIRSENNCSQAAKANYRKANLHQQIVIAKDCEVVLTTNLWKETGLTNGAKGVVKYIVYEQGKRPPQLPFIVFVQFHNYTGPSYFEDIDRCVPIVPVTRVWVGEGGKSLSRTMLPIIAGYAITLHKSQGLSLDQALINLGHREFAPGLSYVGISRVKKVEKLAFYPKIPNLIRFTSIKAQKVSKERKKQDDKEKVSDETN